MSRNREADAEECKAKGNEALKAKDFDLAIQWYGEALKLHKSHVYYSNRSAAYLSKGFGDSALKDAEECLKLKPDFAKGYSRKGAALHKLGKLKESIAVYEEGLKLDPENAGLKSGLDAAQQALAGPVPSAGGGAAGAGLFGADFMDKIRANPKISKYLSDPSYVQMIEMIQNNPQMLQFAAQDPRIQETFSEVLGIQFQTQPPEVDEEERKRRKKEEEEREKKQKEAAKLAEQKRKEEEERLRREKETPEEREKRENQEKALEFKTQGNELYKKREFAQALEMYEKAIELDPENMTFHLNIASVKLEEKDLDGCIEKCKKAIEVGRSVYAPYDQVAKAYERMGNAYYKYKRWSEAVEQYKNAQLEHANPKVANKMKQAEKNLKKEEAEKYLNPEIAEEEKAKGNEFFKEGKWPDAIKHYTEAIKRNPASAVYYGNRATAYMKLMDFGRAKDDIESGLKIDPKYSKLYARKGNIEFFLKEYHKAVKSYQLGIDLDNNSECVQGLAKTRYAIQASSGESNQQRASRAMEDPEIRGIMSDPIMKQVLEDMSKNPAAAREHMANPEIAQKIETLIAAGIIQTR